MRQGLTLVHSSAQRELFLSLNSTEAPNVSLEKCSRQAEKWTSVSPCSEGYQHKREVSNESFPLGKGAEVLRFRPVGHARAFTMPEPLSHTR